MKNLMGFFLAAAGISCCYYAFALAQQNSDIWGWFLFVSLIIFGGAVDCVTSFVSSVSEKE